MAEIGKLQWSREGAGPQNSAQETKAGKVEGGDGEGVQEEQEVHMHVKEQVEKQVEQVEQEVQMEVQWQQEVAHVQEAEEAKLRQAVLLVEQGRNDM